MTPNGFSLGIVLIEGLPTMLLELLIPRFRVEKGGNNEVGSPVRLAEADLIVFVILGIRGGGPEL